jgi:hypothetical protein
MTDLEKLWADLPTGQPPVDAILRGGRLEVEARRRRLVARPLVAVGAVAAILVTFVLGVRVGDSSGVTGTPPPTDARFAAFQADLDPATSCDELLASYRDRGLAQVTAWGWSGTLARFGDVVNERGPLLEAPTYRAQTASQTARDTGTNVQETGVDEPDGVKTDGTRLVRVRGDDLVVYDATGDRMRVVSTTRLPRMDDAEILLDGDVVVAIGADRSTARDEVTGLRRGSRVITISLADAGPPAVTSDVTYSSRVVSARQHGSVVRLVLAAGLPDLGFTRPGSGVSTADALAANRRAVSSSTIDDWLPTYDTGDGTRQLLDCTHVAIPDDEVGLDTVSVVGLDTSAAARPEAIGLAGATTIAYESPDHLYLASSPATTGCLCGIAAGRRTASAAGTSHVFDFELDGVSSRHVASGEIEGSIADRWSIDEAGGVLRVAVGPTRETGQFSSVVTMHRSGTRLVELGRVDGLGPGEQIKSVRWSDDLAIVVTFRQVDPLYTIDLTDPAGPRLAGELKIPGYSEYLHPVGADELLGIGYDGRGRDARIALFDIGDLSDVQQDAVESYPGTEALATTDPRSFTWLPDRDLVLTVVRHKDVVSVAAVTVRDGRLTSTLTPVGRGSDATQVRTLELDDGRVALVTGDDVTFFPLA